MKSRKVDAGAYSIRAVDRAVQVLMCFSFQRQRLSLGDLVQCTSLSKPTLFRLLQTLELNQFVSYDPETQRYSLGLKILELGRIAFSGFTLNAVAAPFLNQLVTEGKSRVALVVLSDEELIYIDERRGPEYLAMSGTEIGQRRPPHYCGAHGMVLMAYLTTDEVDRLLEKHPLTKRTSLSIVDPEEFKAKLKEVREIGYAFEEGQVAEGMSAAAAPIFDHLGKVVAAVGASLTSASLVGDKRDAIIKAVLNTGKKISEAYGFSEARMESQ